LSLHGFYGLCWLMKDQIFPDASFASKVSISACILHWIVTLGPYSMIPVAVTSGYAEDAKDISHERAFVAIFTFLTGLTIMMVSDA